MLAVHEAQRAGYDEAILLTDEGYVADGSGENMFVVKDGRIWTPPLSTSILPGITRDSVIQIAQDLGYVVEEANLIRSDLYLADEIFMTGTAAEVTPVRSVDDHEIGVGPITLELQKAYLDTVRGKSERWGHWLDRVTVATRLPPRRERRHAAIPLSSPYLDERDEELVLEVLRSGRLSLGPTIDRFEELFAEKVGAPYAAAVSSGTAGLHLLCAIAGLGAGDEVITSPYSFVASANCFIYEGATPVFADVDERTMNLDPAAVEAAITRADEGDRRGRHLRLSVRARPAARALRAARPRADPGRLRGARGRVQGARVGSHGVDAVFAFYPNKQMTTGEGGMVTTHDEETWRRLVSLRNQGRADGGGWLEHARLGFNYRIDDIRAALGIGQLEKLDTILSLRQAAAARYGELLGGVDGLELPLADDADHVRSWFVYVVTLARGIDRERVIAELERQGIATSRYLPSIHLQAYMRERYGFREGFARSRRISRSARSRSRSSPRSRRRTRNESPRRSRPRWAEARRRRLGLFGLQAPATLVTYRGSRRRCSTTSTGAAIRRWAGAHARPAQLSARARRDRARAIAGGPRLLVWAAIALCAVTLCRASSTRTTSTRGGSTPCPRSASRWRSD